MTIRRNVSASDSKQLLHGRWFRRPIEEPNWWQRLFGIQFERGSYFETELLEEEAALQAFDQAMRDAGKFSIDTAFDAKLDFHPTKDQGKLWVDCWSFESGLDEILLTRADARKLVSLLFTECTERDVIAFLRKVDATLEPADVHI